MTGAEAAADLRRERHYLQNILKDFKPEHGDFRPVEAMMSVAQQINHIAFTTRWFREGAFGAGFNMDFAMIEAENKRQLTLEEAMARLDAAYDGFAAFLAGLSEADLAAPMPANPIFGEAPRLAVLAANADHTAHHRGALSVYLRLLGITPTMIYEE